MEKEDIVHSLKELEDISVLEENKDNILIFDEVDSKEIRFHFKEYFSFKSLSDRVYVSKHIPKKYRHIFNKTNIVKTLLSKIDQNCLITMDKLWIMYDERDEQELEDYTSDEYAREILSDNLVGITWFERNICIISAKKLIELSKEIYYDDYNVKKEVEIGLWTTIIHELRHLLLDTNIILPEDEYPIGLAAEEKVEEYCRAYYDQNF